MLDKIKSNYNSIHNNGYLLADKVINQPYKAHNCNNLIELVEGFVNIDSRNFIVND